MGKRDKPEPAAPAGPFNNPFAKLAEQRAQLPSAPAAPPAPAKEPKGPARAVVRMERKGRGGKEVTVVEQLELASGAGANARALDEWCKALKQSLGCGGVVEGDAIVLQGDQRERLPALLEKRGVRKVIVG